MLQPLDYAYLSIAAVCVVVGLVRGLSGCLAFVAAVATALCSARPIYALAGGMGCAGGWQWVAAVVGVLVAAAVVRFVVARFVSVCVPQPFDAILGACTGVLLALLLTAASTVIGFAVTGRFSGGFPAEKSVLAARAGGWLDACGGFGP